MLTSQKAVKEKLRSGKFRIRKHLRNSGKICYRILTESGSPEANVRLRPVDRLISKGWLRVITKGEYSGTLVRDLGKV